jgi:ABC-type Mn2+/Zn2+ transport system ATPase subunit
MIQIKAIHIEEFRGIRELDLTLNCKSFAVWGPNGSGKSGVVDALDFALSGTIGRLAGPGTSGLTVAKHGPHVHQRDNPASAKVRLTVHDTVSGLEAVLTRSVKSPGKVSLEPDTPEMRTAVAQVGQYPELTLSRREIIKYVVTEPGARAEQVQGLLKLDRIDLTRKLLRSALTKASSDLNAANSELGNAEEAVLRHFELTSLLASELTKATNARRSVLGLGLFDAVTVDTDLHEGLSSEGPLDGFNRTSAVADVRALLTRIETPTTLVDATTVLATALDEVESDPSILEALQHRRLVEAGLELLIGPTCPLCDLEWEDIESLTAHLRERIARSEVAAGLQQRIAAASIGVRSAVGEVRELIRTCEPHAATADGDDGLSTRLRTWSDDLVTFGVRLSTTDGALSQLDRIRSDALAAPSNLLSDLEDLAANLDAKPDQTAANEARTFLTVAQERWKRVRVARAEPSRAGAGQRTAKVIYDTYCTVADDALTTLYKTVEDDFSAYYRTINSDDESTFKAELEPSAGKLDLTVDFYGLGMFPPAAYHSEGHQDGMGVCLYLALLQHLLGSDFRLAILDDVVMSVDRNHRRQFCELLRTTFPNVQFIITTHDEVWARQMQNSGLITRSGQARFHGWSVNSGPVCDEGEDVWARIDSDLECDDVPAAAARLRRHLEAVTADLAAGIGGQVAYRSDADYDLGQLLTAVKSRHGELLGKAAQSAQSWNNDEALNAIKAIKAQRSKAIPVQEGENWVINKLVHNNDWAAITKEDFTPVLVATRQFLDLFRCDNPECGSWIQLSGSPTDPDALRCQCQAYNLNLRSK